MKLTITSIELKSPFHFFALSHSALGITRQLKSANCVEFRKKGFWTTHYTMTLWKSEEDLKSFAGSGAHLQAMRDSGKIAREIKTLTTDAAEMPAWPEAMALLQQVPPLVFGRGEASKS